MLIKNILCNIWMSGISFGIFFGILYWIYYEILIGIYDNKFCN